MKRKVLVLSFLLLGLVFPRSVLATDLPNNKFGIHLAVVTNEELQDAAALVDSSGGDWGYVTVVIEENDRNQKKWQDAFDQMRELHLIPIVRLATRFENGSWRRPAAADAGGWADFLDSLNWVIKDRFVVLFNEPNDNREWGGAIDGRGYGEVALSFAKKLKEKSADFKPLLAGFNATAPHALPAYEREDFFLHQVFSAAPDGINEFFNYFDYWASHSYSASTYQDELGLLHRLGLNKSLPVLITETGWANAQSSDLMTNFFLRVSKDQRVLAVTPFVLNYQGFPFATFSWRRLGEPKEFYPQYYAVQKLAKTKGEPEQLQGLQVLSDLPKELIANSSYQIPIRIKNQGQAIWSVDEGYQLGLVDDSQVISDFFFSDFPKIAPLEEGVVMLNFKTTDRVGSFNFNLSLKKSGKTVAETISWPLKIISPIDIKVMVSLLPKIKANGSDFHFLIYNSAEQVIFEKGNLQIADGQGLVERVTNLVVGEKYRFVLLKPYYLPRQRVAEVKEKDSQVSFRSMLPLDANSDGRLSLIDLFGFIFQPSLWGLWRPF